MNIDLLDGTHAIPYLSSNDKLFIKLLKMDRGMIRSQSIVGVLADV